MLALQSWAGKADSPALLGKERQQAHHMLPSCGRVWFRPDIADD